MQSPSERIDDLIAEPPGWQGATLARLRKVIHDADPGIIEEWKWVTARRPGTPVFEHDGMVCHINILKERVRLTLHEGACLPDPKGLFNASLEGNERRGIDFYEGDQLDEDAVRAVVRAGVEYNLANRRTRSGR